MENQKNIYLYTAIHDDEDEIYEKTEDNMVRQIFYWKDWTPRWFKDYDVYVTLYKFICPNCGTRIIGQWCNVNTADLSFIPLAEQTNLRYSERQYYANNHDKYVELVNRCKNSIENCKVSSKKHSDKTCQEMENMAKLKQCPICNHELSKEFPFAYIERPWYRLEELEDIFQKSKDIDYETHEKLLQEHLKAESVKKAERFIQQCNIEFIKSETSIPQNTDFLKKYLSHLINLESNIIFMSDRLKYLYQLKTETDMDVAFDSNYPTYNSIQSFEQKIGKITEMIEKLNCEKSELENTAVSVNRIAPPTPPQKPIFQKPSFFNRKRVEAQNAQLQLEYEQRVNEYNAKRINIEKQNVINLENAKKEKEAKLIEYDKEIAKCKDQITALQDEIQKSREEKKDYPSLALGKKQMIDSEITIVEETLKNTFKCRNEMYSYDIIFEKYRDIVAISSFYEYLMSGRCVSLDGDNGAYNIYENEIRLNSIIFKLDDIKSNLERIERNQFMIYKKLTDIESSLVSLNATMEKAVESLNSIYTESLTIESYLEKISEDTEIIAHNTAVSAYYSKKNAELTNALGFLMAMK
ncbi:MAG: hypothetical protein J6A96_05555 [Clostridia bacterium]|nr:hypothetical protein [Clostridia bacterium]